MTPAFLLLRLMALVLVPLLVAPSIVSLGADGARRSVDGAALALSPAGLAATAIDPLVPLPLSALPEALTTTEAPAAELTAPTAADGVRAAAPVDDAAATPPADADDAAAAPTATEDAKADTSKSKAPAKAKAPAKTPAKAEKGEQANAEEAKDKKAKDKKAKDKKGKAEKAKAEEAQQKQAEQAKAKQAAAQPARAAAAAPAGRTVSLYLAVGHGRAPNGRWQPGAENPRTGAQEVVAAQTMVDAMVEVLRDAPNLELHVESGDHPNVIGSVANANGLGVDDCVEVHQDTAAAPPGVFAHWYTDAKAAKRLADRMVGAVENQGVPVRHDWHRERPGLYWVRKSTCRAVLLEVGRVGDFSTEQLRTHGHAMARAYLRDTAEARGVAE